MTQKNRTIKISYIYKRHHLLEKKNFSQVYLHSAILKRGRNNKILTIFLFPQEDFEIIKKFLI